MPSVSPRIAFIILAHDQPDYLAAFAHALSRCGDHVLIHFDAAASDADFETLTRTTFDSPSITLLPRTRTQWGTFGLVAATLAAIGHVRDAAISVTHVQLLSGADIATQSLERYRSFLASHGEQDFIEYYPGFDNNWVIGDDVAERWALRFPISIRQSATAFRTIRAVQRRLGVRRHVPEGLEPAFGSQWWCLRWQTCSAIMDLCVQRPDLQEFFRLTWIPDECFFQSLLPMSGLSPQHPGRTLTFYQFDSSGTAQTFDDTDADWLFDLKDSYFARKVTAQSPDLRMKSLKILQSKVY